MSKLEVIVKRIEERLDVMLIASLYRARKPEDNWDRVAEEYILQVAPDIGLFSGHPSLPIIGVEDRQSLRRFMQGLIPDVAPESTDENNSRHHPYDTRSYGILNYEEPLTSVETVAHGLPIKACRVGNSGYGKEVHGRLASLAATLQLRGTYTPQFLRIIQVFVHPNYDSACSYVRCFRSHEEFMHRLYPKVEEYTPHNVIMSRAA